MEAQLAASAVEACVLGSSRKPQSWTVPGPPDFAGVNQWSREPTQYNDLEPPGTARHELPDRKAQPNPT